MRLEYPNLELLEYKAMLALSKDEYFRQKFQEIRNKSNYARMEIEAEMFPQLWGSTCTGFDVTQDGEPALGGAAMTKAYTTVLHELNTDIYLVCFGDELCYMVTDANEDFHEDLQKRHMASLSEAKRRY